jgi:S-adenosylmethionine:tRNA ribosyltransferase-isomerase
MKLSELDFHLAAERIAQHPLAERDASRMLLLNRVSGDWEDRHFREFPDLLHGNELIVLNNARVLPARLFGYREGIRASEPEIHNPERHQFLRAQIEVLLVRQLSADTWQTLVRPGRKIRVGGRIHFGDGELSAQVESRGDYGLRVLRFSSRNGFHEAVHRLGHIPLPPYIKREDEPADRERYQTVFAKAGVAVAAPTAGLHFSAAILDRLAARKIEIAEITLDVGLGTFEPVRTERLEDHKIHAETYEIPGTAAAAIAKARKENRPVLAVGTTVVRALEDAAAKNEGEVAPGKAEATIYLYPGKKFPVIDQLLTNFHLPQTSLLAMVAAFAGTENVLGAYRHAVDTRYRFYSYGDCMFIR